VFRYAATDLVVSERVARIPRIPQHYAPPQPPIQISSTTQEPEVFNIGEKKSRADKSRSTQRRKKRDEHMTQDIDADAQAAYNMAIADAEMQQQRDDELRERSIVIHKLMLEEASNKAIDDLMAGRGDKRREEGADPKPAKAKAKTTKPKAEADESPEAKHEPKGPRGRPPNTRASASTDVPPQASPEPKTKVSPKKEAKPKVSPKKEAKPKAEAQPEAEATEPKTKTKPVKKDMPKKNEQKGTAKVYDSSFEEWKSNSNKASLVDQYNLRRIGTYLRTKNDMKSITVKQLIEKILDYDIKNKR
jgi:hypothetical protein